jgi:catechol 2,3-dioxygenase-like lactoylglutathione lyase family enzyme
MITALDHVVVLTGDIEAATAAYQTLFARSPSWKNSTDGAARVLFTLDNTTLELVAPSGEGESANRIRPVLITQGEGLASLCFRTNDIERLHRRLERLTLRPEPVSEVESQRCRGSARARPPRRRAACGCSFSSGKKSGRCRSAPRRARSPRWIMWWSQPPTPNAPLRFMVRGLGSTWRSIVHTRIGDG